MKTILTELSGFKVNLKKQVIFLLAFIVGGFVNSALEAQSIYVASNGSSEVTVVDLATQSISSSIALSAAPVKIDASPSGNQLAVVGTSSITFIDPNGNAILSSSAIPNSAEIRDVAYNADGSVAYTIDQLTTLVTPFNTSSFAAGTFGFLSSGTAPVAGAVDPVSGTLVVVNNGSGDLATFTPSPLSQTGLNINVGASPQEIAFLPGQDIAYVTNFNGNSVSVIDLSERSVRVIGGTSDQANLIVNPVGVIANSTGTTVYVVENGTDQVAVIDVASNTVTGRIDVGSDPRGIDITPDDAVLAVSNFGDNSISIIDLATSNVNTVTGIEGPLSLAIAGISNDSPVAAFTATPATGEAPLTVDFDASASTDDMGIESYAWDFGDGNTGSGEMVSNTYMEAGEYEVRLIVTDAFGESDTATTTINVEMPNELPIATFTATPTSGFAPLEVAFDATASSDDGTIIEYLWDFGDGNTGMGATVSNTFTTPGDYTVTLVVSDNRGAADTATTSISVILNEAPVPVIATSVSEGVVPFSVEFDATGSTDAEGESLSYEWDFGNGETAFTEVATTEYTVAGNYLVTLTVVDDFGNQATATTTIVASDPTNMAPTADFTATPDSGDAPLEVSFDASNSMDSDGTIESYSWNFGDGNTGSGVMVSNTYSEAGTYTVTLTVTDDDGAVDNISLTIVVNAVPVSAFTASPMTGTAPLTVAFDGSGSSDADGEIAAYDWDFGDGNTASGVMVNNTFMEPGTYTVTLTVTDANESTASSTMEIVVNAAPTAAFTADPTEGNAPLIVSFDASASTDSDGNIVSYDWDFGNGNTDTGVNVTNAYEESGVFTATLVVTDDSGATDTASTQITINQVPTASFTLDPSGGVAPLTITVDASASTDSDGEIAFYDWDFGNGNTASGVTAENTYNDPGSYSITLTVTDDDGATAIIIRSIFVSQPVGVIRQALQDTLDNQTLTLVDAGLNFGGVTASVINQNGDQFNVVTGQSTPAISMEANLRIGASDVTQMIMAVLTFALRDEGALNLDQPISDFISTSGLTNIPDGITIRQLLNHTSGLADFASASNYQTEVLFDVTRNFTPEDITALFVGAPAATGNFNYSRTNFLILGLVLDAANGGETVQQSFDRLIAGPSSAMGFEFYENSDPSDLVPLFADVSGFGFPQQLVPNTSIFSAAGFAGNLIATPEQMMIMTQSLVEGNILGEASLNEMLSFVSREGRLSEQYGLGVEQFTLNIAGNEVDFIGHIGNVNYVSVLLYSPELSTGVYLSTNNAVASQEDVLELARKLLTIVVEGTIVDVDEAPVEDFAQSILLAPNPANTNMTIQFNSIALDNGIYHIIDMNGRLIEMQEFENNGNGTLNINVGNLNNGTYILSVRIGNAIANKKFIVQH